MKLFERPVAELIVFNVADVITTSTTCGDDCEDDIPIETADLFCF